MAKMSEEKKKPMTVAERKRKSRELKREAGLQQLEIEIPYALRAKIEWSAKKQGLNVREYILQCLEEGHKQIA